MIPFHGVITAIATPFEHDQSIDLKSFENLIRLQKTAGIQGIIVGGTTGESPTLTESELETLVATALEHQTTDFFVYVGTGGSCTQSAIDKSVFYSNFCSPSDQRPKGIMVVVPPYNKPTQQGLIEHFCRIADAVQNTPLCVYNVPGRTALSLQPETFTKLVQLCKNICALKEASGNVALLGEFYNHLKSISRHNDVRILSGDDATFAPSLIAGSQGVVSVSSNIIPWAIQELWQAAKQNNLNKVTELHHQVSAINRDLFCSSNPIPLKWALNYLNLSKEFLRLPLTPLEEPQITALKTTLETAQKTGVRMGI